MTAFLLYIFVLWLIWGWLSRPSYVDIAPQGPATINVMTPSIVIHAHRVEKRYKAAALRIWLGVFPVQRLHAWVNALTSRKPTSHAILDTGSLGSSR
jgi:hypothetical protein